MKKLYVISIAAVLLLITTAVFAGNYFYSAAAKDEAARISLDDAKKVFDENGAVFLDTRSETAYKEERIKGALNINSGNLDTRIKDLPKDKKIIVYCS